MITRNDIYKQFIAEFQLSEVHAESIFRAMTDNDLAKAYGLKVLRKGYFVR